MKALFLKAGVWDSEAHPLQTVGLKLVYPLDEGRLTLSLESGVVIQRLEEESKQASGVLIYGNFHRDCHGYPSKDQVIGRLGKVEQDWAAYQSILSDLLKI